MGPRTNQSPAGITTRPPPAFVHAAIALSIAGLQSLFPSRTAPYSVIAKSRSAKRGSFIRAMISGTADQPVCVSAATHAADVAKIAAIANDAKRGGIVQKKRRPA